MTRKQKSDARGESKRVKDPAKARAAKEALLIWNMITAETEEGREPLQSKTQPELKPPERRAMVEKGFITLEAKQGKPGTHVVLTDKAWEWAANATGVEIMRSQFSADALQGLLRRLLPFLKEHDIPLAALFPTTVEFRTPAGSAAAPDPPTASVPAQIEAACLSLAAGARGTRVRLRSLREQLSGIDRSTLDRTLLELQDQGRLVLYREDNTAALTQADQLAALTVGGEPRHLVLLGV